MNLSDNADLNVVADPPQPPPTPVVTKVTIEARIREAKMPQATKKLATKLLERNKQVGTYFVLKLSDLRGMCHAATNLDVIKHLRRMRAQNLMTYTIFFDRQTVELRFMTEGKQQGQQ